jgi:hypothetical protein
MTARTARRTIAALASLVLVGGLAATGPVAASAGSPAARPTWSTSPATVTRTPSSIPLVTGIRVGRHAGFDRVVLDLSGKAPGYSVRYVKKLRHDGSGAVADLRGRKSLQIVLTPAYAHNDTNGAPTLTTPDRQTFSHPQIREYALLGDFEGYVTVGIGLRHKEPFRVLTLSNPKRIVIDIKH